MFLESVLNYKDQMENRNLALGMSGLGVAFCKLGELSKAREYIYKALKMSISIGDLTVLMRMFPPVALLQVEFGEIEWAVELYEMAISRFPFVAKACHFEAIFGKQITNAAVNLPLEVVSAAKKRGRALDFEITATELLAELEELLNG